MQLGRSTSSQLKPTPPKRELRRLRRGAGGAVAAVAMGAEAPGPPRIGSATATAVAAPGLEASSMVGKRRIGHGQQRPAIARRRRVRPVVASRRGRGRRAGAVGGGSRPGASAPGVAVRERWAAVLAAAGRGRGTACRLRPPACQRATSRAPTGAGLVRGAAGRRAPAPAAPASGRSISNGERSSGGGVGMGCWAPRSGAAGPFLGLTLLGRRRLGRLDRIVLQNLLGVRALGTGQTPALRERPPLGREIPVILRAVELVDRVLVRDTAPAPAGSGAGASARSAGPGPALTGSRGPSRRPAACPGFRLHDFVSIPCLVRSR